ncbi:hypothetical protein BJ979_002910 [Schumannella luteola]|uniref:Uncharacterized protein n=1 Tax=Schumannella luteola TaxID=472059 RepID=A0A852YG57_9MICO|nr:hypothetical protein [Schumannella luteola]
MLTSIMSHSDSLRWFRRREAEASFGIPASDAVISAGECSSECGLDRRPVMHDLPVGEAQDAIARRDESSVSIGVALPIVELAAVDLDDEPIAEHGIHSIGTDPDLLTDADPEPRRPADEERLGAAAGQRRRCREQSSKMVRQLSGDRTQLVLTQHPVREGRLDDDQRDLRRLTPRDVDEHLDSPRQEAASGSLPQCGVSGPVDDRLTRCEASHGVVRRSKLRRAVRDSDVHDGRRLGNPEPPVRGRRKAGQAATDARGRHQRSRHGRIGVPAFSHMGQAAIEHELTDAHASHSESQQLRRGDQAASLCDLTPDPVHPSRLARFPSSRGVDRADGENPTRTAGVEESGSAGRGQTISRSCCDW